MSDEIKYSDINKSFEAAVERSKKIEADLNVNPKKYRVLTGLISALTEFYVL